MWQRVPNEQYLLERLYAGTLILPGFSFALIFFCTESHSHIVTLARMPFFNAVYLYRVLLERGFLSL